MISLATIVRTMDNMSMYSLELQYRNDSLIQSIAEYVCSLKLRRSFDLHCQEFPGEHSIAAQAFAAIAFTLLIVAAVIGNSVVMWIIASHKVMHRGFNYFLFNMSFADCLIALNVSTTWTFNFYYDWWYGEAFCSVNNFFGIAPTCVSAFSMMIVSWDRYNAVVNPLGKHQLSNATTIVVIGVIWAAATACSLPSAFTSHLQKHFFFSPKSKSLNYRWLCVSEFSDKESYERALLVVQYVLPLLVLSFTYARIAYAFRRTDLELNMAMASSKAKVHVETKRRAVKMLAVVVAIFMICWLPYHLYWVFETMMSDFRLTSYIYLVSYWLAMSAAVYNPIIYCYANSRFRIGFRHVFRWLPCIDATVDDYELSELFPERLLSVALNARNTRSDARTRFSTYSVADIENSDSGVHNNNNNNHSSSPYHGVRISYSQKMMPRSASSLSNDNRERLSSVGSAAERLVDADRLRQTLRNGVGAHPETSAIAADGEQ